MNKMTSIHLVGGPADGNFLVVATGLTRISLAALSLVPDSPGTELTRPFDPRTNVYYKPEYPTRYDRDGREIWQYQG